MTIRVEVDGLAELKRALRRLPDSVQGAPLERASEDVWSDVGDKARSIAPRDTGRLANSIDTDVEKSEPDRVEIVVGPDVPYAVPVEFGTSRTSAQPFMRPAFDTKWRGAADALEKALGRLIARAWR